MIYPLFQEILYQEPSKLFSLFAEQEGSVLLDSAQQHAEYGRYSYIGVEPFQILSSKNHHVTLDKTPQFTDPITLLENQLANFPLFFYKDLPPFQGGVMGFFSYDVCQYLEKISLPPDDVGFPDMCLGFYDVVIAFDIFKKRAWIFSSGLPLLEKKSREEYALTRIKKIIKKLASVTLDKDKLPIENYHLESTFNSQTYQVAVQKVKDYILAGDIFEANISQRFKASLSDNFNAYQLYQALRLKNPAPFAAFINIANTQLLSASPERFLKLENKKIEACPIKGTRPRGKNEIDDKKFADELLQSEKDHSENVMIVDLLRNDLSKVCEDHSVNVQQLCGLESFTNVHHLVSVVVGQLKNSYHAIDLLRASFPGGSITGAPKVRAMEIISEIEPNRRGPYCGSIGYIAFNGDMDLSITIRTFSIYNRMLTFQVGGAIVADSDPLEEYEETLTKAKGLFAALEFDIQHL